MKQAQNLGLKCWKNISKLDKLIGFNYMKKTLSPLLFTFLLCLSLNSNALEAEAIVSASMLSFAKTLADQALIWLVSFAGLQFVITNIGLFKSGADIEAIFGKFIGSLLWIGFCFYLLTHGPSFIDAVGNQFIGLLDVKLPNTADILLATYIPGIALLGSAVFVGGMGAVGSVVGGQVLMMIAFFIMAMGTYFVIKLFMIKLELLIVVILSPLSFAFLGLNALKDQGIAPLKSLISLGYRIILMTILFGAFSQLPGLLDTIANGKNKLTSVSNILLAINPVGNAYGLLDFYYDLFNVILGHIIIFYLLYKSDSIAASLASGSTNMGAGDVASAAAAGAALGAAGAAAANPVVDKGKSMSEVIKGLGGDAGKITDVSTKGGGGIEQKPVGDVPPPPPKEAEMSLQEMRDHPSAIGNQSKDTGGGDSPTSSESGNNALSETTNSESTGETPSNTSQLDSDSSAATKAANTIDNLSSSGKLKDADTAKHVSDHLKSADSNLSDAKAVGDVPSKEATPAAGSGESAGIGGAASATDQKLDKLIDSMSAPSKPGFMDKLSTANDHIAKEQAATVVSINTHHSD